VTLFGHDLFEWTLIALLVAMILVRKVHEHRAGKRSTLRGTPIVEASLMVLWGVAAGFLPFLHIFSGWLDFATYPFVLPWPLGVLGVALFGCAIWLLHRSHADLGSRWSSTVEKGDGQRLVTEGVYRHVRHPMYAAHLIWGVAQALLLPNLLAGLMPLALMLLLIALRMRREERVLLEEFGDDYRNYMARTGRLLPRLRT